MSAKTIEKSLNWHKKIVFLKRRIIVILAIVHNYHKILMNETKKIYCLYQKTDINNKQYLIQH